MADLSRFDLEDLADILQDQGASDDGMDYYVHRKTGEVLLDSDGIDLDVAPAEDDDYVYVDAIPSYEWYQDMADFTAALSDRRVAADLERALDGKGAFRRFASVTMGRHGHLETPWQQFRRIRAHRRAAQWLADVGVVDQEQVDAYAAEHPDPAVP